MRSVIRARLVQLGSLFAIVAFVFGAAILILYWFGAHL